MMTLRRAGFTMVELMIVVAIIGILAAIAIPSYQAMQLKAKRAEIPPNLKAIQAAELGYEAVFDEYMGIIEPHPRIDEKLDKNAVPWDGDANYARLGWAPSGDIRGNYQISVSVTGEEEHLLITGKSDVDDDNYFAIYTCTDVKGAELTSDEGIY